MRASPATKLPVCITDKHGEYGITAEDTENYTRCKDPVPSIIFPFSMLNMVAQLQLDRMWLEVVLSF
jgi:hypothetical protein